MNRIYKLVWSKVKNCYIAVSELAKSRTKSPGSGVISRTVAAGVLACILSCGAVMPVMAAGATYSFNSETNEIVITDPNGTSHNYSTPCDGSLQTVSWQGHTAKTWQSADKKSFYFITQSTTPVYEIDEETGEPKLDEDGNKIKIGDTYSYNISNSVAAGYTDPYNYEYVYVGLPGQYDSQYHQYRLDSRLTNSGNVAVSYNKATMSWESTSGLTGWSDVDVRTSAGGNANSYMQGSIYGGMGSYNDATNRNDVIIGGNITVDEFRRLHGITSVGSNMMIHNNMDGGAMYSTAVGYGSTIKAPYSVTVGVDNEAGGSRSVVVGTRSRASEVGSVAIGDEAVSESSNAVSFGHYAGDTDVMGNPYGTESKKRLIHVDNGIMDTDAVNMSQLPTGTVVDNNMIYLVDKNGRRMRLLEAENNINADNIHNHVVVAPAAAIIDVIGPLGNRTYDKLKLYNIGDNEIEKIKAAYDGLISPEVFDASRQVNVSVSQSSGNWRQVGVQNGLPVWQNQNTGETYTGTNPPSSTSVYKNYGSLSFPELDRLVSAGVVSTEYASEIRSYLENSSGWTLENGEPVPSANGSYTVVLSDEAKERAFNRFGLGRYMNRQLEEISYDEDYIKLNVQNLGVNSDKTSTDTNINLNGEGAIGENSIALGVNTKVTGKNSIAVGTGHQIAGNNSGAFGDPDIVDGDSSYVVGNNSSVAAGTSDVFVFGNNVNATGTNTVVLGTGSDGSQSNVVSVGSSVNKRRIVNVADGIADTDVATVGQLKSMGGGSSIHGVGINNITESSTNYNGEGAMGVDSIAIGDAKAAGSASVAIGTGAIATGNNSIAFGTNATATGDGMTREQVNSILSNNKAIRDALNGARAGYTQSKADYDRQKEIWEGQNEAVARVQHANELIAGYQAEINNTLRPNAESANNTYNQAKNDYDTLYNDFQNRLQEVKYINFTVYQDGSAAGYDYDRMASDLKTKVETGTSFNMPVSFYNDYIHNYIKANGDLRLVSLASSSFNYRASTSSFSDSYSQYLSGYDFRQIDSLYPKVYYKDENNKYKSYDLGDGRYIHISTLNEYFQKFDSNFNLNLNTMEIRNLNNSNDGFTTNLPHGSYSNLGIISSGQMSNATTVINKLLQLATFTDEQKSTAYNLVDTVATHNKGIVETLANEMVSIGQMTNEQKDSYLQIYDSLLGNEITLVKNLIDVGYYQKKYEDTHDIAYIGNKELAISNANDILKSGEAITYIEKGINNNAISGSSSDNNSSLTMAFSRYLRNHDLNTPDVLQAITVYLKENMTDVQDATVVALRAVTDGLEGQLAEKKQALNEATAAKKTADDALSAKQKQITDTTPSQQDLDDAAAAQASADELEQKKDKLDADLEALNQAKANLENLENIAGEGESPIAIGNNALVTGKNAVGLGRDSFVTGEDGIGIGRNTVVSGKQSIGIGSDNSISKDNAIAIGTNNGITGANSIAIGNNNVVSGENSIAIGNGLSVTEDNTVALGGKKVSGVIDGTVATDASTIGQTGSTLAVDGKKLLLKNALGTELGSVDLPDSGETYTAGSGLKLEDNAFSVETDGAIATSNTGVLKGGTVYNEVRPDQDGVFVKNANTAGQNFLALDGEVACVKARMDDAVIYDGANHAKATLTGGTTGTTLDNVKNGLITRTSKEAINGGQLWSVKQDIAGFAADIERNTNSIQTLNGSVSNALASVAAANTLVNTVNDLKADASLNNLSDAGKQVISSAAIDAVQQYMASQNSSGSNSANPNTGMSTNHSSAYMSDLIDDLADNDGTVGNYNSNQNRSRVSSSLKVMSSGAAADTNFVVYDDADASQITLEDATGEGTKITNLAEGSLSAASTDAVNGSQLYKTNRDVAAMQETLSTNNGTVAALQTDTQTLKTNMITLQSQYATTKTQVENGFNVTVDGAKVKTVNPDSAYMDFATGNHTEILNDNGSVRINVKDDGQIANGNSGLVTGDTVAGETRVAGNGNYILKGNSAAQNLSVLDTVLKETRVLAEAAAASGEDANAVHYDATDHSSITLGGENGTLITNLKDGAVTADSTDAVTGKQLFATNEKLDALDALVGTVDDGNYVSADISMGENINVLDGQLKTVSDGLDTVRSDVAVLRTDVDDLNDKVTGFEVELDGKADTDLGNLTDSGKTVISDIARESVKVKGAGLAKVTSVENGNTTVYTVNVQADGKVEENNSGLVNGGTVYNSINVVRDEFAEDLDGKADLDLSNISDGGKTVIREVMKADLAKKADKADLNKKANFDASNINVDAWAAKLGTGEVAEGNTGLVNGGTVFDAIQRVDRNNNIVEIQDDVIYMGAREGGNVISVYNNEGEGRVITGVITNPEDSTSAANVGYVNAIGDNIVNGMNKEFDRMNNKISDVGANAAAMASLTPGGLDGDEKFGVAAAVGNYRNATAGAVGLFYKPQDNIVMNARASFGTNDNMLGAGVYFGLNKGNTPGVTKATLIRAVNAQAAKLTDQDAVIANQNAEISELKSQMAEVMKELAVAKSDARKN